MEEETVTIEVHCDLSRDEEVKYLRKELYEYRLLSKYTVFCGVLNIYLAQQPGATWVTWLVYGWVCFLFAFALYKTRRRRFYEWRLKEIE